MKSTQNSVWQIGGTISRFAVLLLLLLLFIHVKIKMAQIGVTTIMINIPNPASLPRFLLRDNHSYYNFFFISELFYAVKYKHTYLQKNTVLRQINAILCIIFCNLLSFSLSTEHCGDDSTPFHRCPHHSSSLLYTVVEYGAAPDSVAFPHSWTFKLFPSFCCYEQCSVSILASAP